MSRKARTAMLPELQLHLFGDMQVDRTTEGRPKSPQRGWLCQCPDPAPDCSSPGDETPERTELEETRPVSSEEEGLMATVGLRLAAVAVRAVRDGRALERT